MGRSCRRLARTRNSGRRREHVRKDPDIAISSRRHSRPPPPGCSSSACSPRRPPSCPAADDRAIRPFTFRATQSDLDELRRRIAATRWPEKETVADRSQGVPLAAARELARYWATDYDWRNGIVAVGVGETRPAEAVHRINEIL